MSITTKRISSTTHTVYIFPKGITLNQAYKQIGNSVCVPVIERIAKEILKILKN